MISLLSHLAWIRTLSSAVWMLLSIVPLTLLGPKNVSNSLALSSEENFSTKFLTSNKIEFNNSNDNKEGIVTDLDQIVHFDSGRTEHTLELVVVLLKELPGLVSAYHWVTQSGNNFSAVCEPNVFLQFKDKYRYIYRKNVWIYWHSLISKIPTLWVPFPSSRSMSKQWSYDSLWLGFRQFCIALNKKNSWQLKLHIPYVREMPLRLWR